MCLCVCVRLWECKYCVSKPYPLLALCNFFPLRGIKAHRPWAVRRWALILRSGNNIAKGKQRIWFWYAILTHPQSHPHTHPHTHTQYIISTFKYVLFLCMVQEGWFWDYKINFIQLNVSLFQGSHNLNKYKDLLMFWWLRWWRISPHRQKIPVKRVLLQAGLRRKLPVEAKKL